MIQVKQPNEKLVFAYDFTKPLGGGTIAQLLVVAAVARGAGAALVNAGQELLDREVKVMWTGGSDGESYLTTVRVRDAVGQEHELDGEIAVIEPGWTMPDGGAPYLTIAEFVAKFGLEETIRMTDADGSGRIDRAMLVGALSDAQAIADVHISAIYTVPLAEVPAIVKLAIGDIARARLYPRGAPDGVADTAKAGLKLLERIGEGKLPLPVSTPLTAAPSSNPILIDQGTRLYPRDGWSDY